MARSLFVILLPLFVGLQLVECKSILSPSTHQLGDILLTDEQWMELKVRKMVQDKRLLWPRNNETQALEIPYKIMDENIDQDVLSQALTGWSDATCITFKQLSQDDQEVKSFLTMNQENNCQAGLGYNPTAPTPVSLAGNACDMVGMMHELGHAFGFNHEQSRSDRDEHIVVKFDNIPEETVEQFKKAKTWNLQTYDYSSIMHYGEQAGSNEGTRGMLTRDARFQFIIGQGKKLSFKDAKTINLAYSCMKDFLEGCNLKANPCQNEGYMGKDCECVCPDGTDGDKCETKKMSYNDAVALKFNKYNLLVKKVNTDVTSVNYPNSLTSALKYSQVFEAPKCQRAVLTFEVFAVQGRSEDDGTCAFDKLELRDDVTQDAGKTFCGKELKAGQVFKSKNQQLILHFTGYNYDSQNMPNKHKGYKAKFTTEPISGCT